MMTNFICFYLSLFLYVSKIMIKAQKIEHLLKAMKMTEIRKSFQTGQPSPIVTYDSRPANLGQIWHHL